MLEKTPNRNRPEQSYEIINLLNTHNIPYQNWGREEAKRLEDLVQEVMEGDCVLESRDGHLFRRVKIAAADVFYQDEQGQTWKLVEDRQILPDGRVRRRHSDGTGPSLGEKIKQGEAPEQAMIRGFKEELNLEIPEDSIKTPLLDESEGPNKNYPGLLAHVTFYRYAVQLQDEHVKKNENGSPQGYVEQDDKGQETYFEWQPVQNQ